MPEFYYEGVSGEGKKVKGQAEALHEGEIRMILRSKGIRPTKITKANMFQTDIGSMLGRGQKVPSEVLVVFTRQLHMLITSGVPVVQALEILEDQTTNNALKKNLLMIRDKVSGGSYLWQAFALYPNTFPKMYTALIRAGEASGALDVIFKRLSRYLEDMEKLRKTIKGAMIYPLLVVVVGIGVVVALLTFVIPRFESLLTSTGQDLPLPTKIVIDVSHFFAANVHFFVIGTFTIGYMVLRWSKTQEGRAVIQRLFFRMPLFGDLIQKGGVARFARTLETLLTSGVTVTDGLDICRETIDNVVLEDATAKVKKEVEAGNSFGGVLTKLSVFPKMASQMISIGESTGNLDKMLGRVADFYEEEVEIKVKGLSKLIEPVILIVLGGIVGGLLISMYLPIFKMAGGGQ